jgi:photosystem II stability/assembly factor-like uncharacterized protein
MPSLSSRNPISLRRPLLAGLVGLTLASSLLAETAYDFFICANINRNYVIGSTIVTTNGLFQRDPDTKTWQHFGYNDTTISAVAFDPRDHDTIYTTTLNGIWVSYDGGDSWKMTNSWDMTEGRDVAVDPQAPDTVYFALPDGIAVSTDRGQTWERRENGLPDRGKFTQTLATDRLVEGKVLAGCEKGIFLTENAGHMWRQVLPTDTQVNDIEQSPHDSDHWFAVTDTHGAWQSTDGGESWSQIGGLPSAEAIYNVTFDATDADRLAIASWAYGVWTSEDGGTTWTERNAGLPAAARAWRVGVDPNSGRLYASIFQETLYYSDDFGRSWEPDALEGSLVNAFLATPRVQP